MLIYLHFWLALILRNLSFTEDKKEEKSLKKGVIYLAIYLNRTFE